MLYLPWYIQSYSFIQHMHPQCCNAHYINLSLTPCLWMTIVIHYLVFIINFFCDKNENSRLHFLLFHSLINLLRWNIFLLRKWLSLSLGFEFAFREKAMKIASFFCRIKAQEKSFVVYLSWLETCTYKSASRSLSCSQGKKKNTKKCSQ